MSRTMSSIVTPFHTHPASETGRRGEGAVEQRDEGLHQRSVSFRTPTPFVKASIACGLSSKIAFQSHPRPRHTAHPKGDVGAPLDS